MCLLLAARAPPRSSATSHFPFGPAVVSMPDHSSQAESRSRTFSSTAAWITFHSDFVMCCASLDLFPVENAGLAGVFVHFFGPLFMLLSDCVRDPMSWKRQ